MRRPRRATVDWVVAEDSLVVVLDSEDVLELEPPPPPPEPEEFVNEVLVKSPSMKW